MSQNAVNDDRDQIKCMFVSRWKQGFVRQGWNVEPDSMVLHKVIPGKMYSAKGRFSALSSMFIRSHTENDVKFKKLTAFFLKNHDGGK